jgi:hypothetical protein
METILYNIKEDTLNYVLNSTVYENIYYQRQRVPSIKQVNNYLNKKNIDPKISSFFGSSKIDIKKGINNIKKSISKIDDHIPLYDEYTKNLYIIKKQNVYNRVIYHSYRFPEQNMLDMFIKKRDKLKDTLAKDTLTKDIEKHLGKFEKTYKNIASKRQYRKLDLMIDFLEQFDLDILNTTYIKVFYYYSNNVGKDITICVKPSFLPHFKHITPYYKRTELINMALNLQVIVPSSIYYDQDKIMELCDLVTSHDLSADIILAHQKYIIDSNKIGIVQYYTIQGSYFMNQYMRGLTSYPYKNELLETSIRSMWELINKAPAFDKSYTLYRFVQNDDYISHLKVGDVYESAGFESTTRDPFYKSEDYQFGYILIKIKIPKNIIGVALCIETVSNFQEELEILLSPRSLLKLEKKDNNVPYYHTDDYYQTKIKTRYEFVYTDKKSIEFKDRPLFDPSKPNNYKPRFGINIKDIKINNKIKKLNRITNPIIPYNNYHIDFLEIQRGNYITANESVYNFLTKYVNALNQFTTKIGNKQYTIIAEWYDSSGAYRKFYSVKTKNGFIMYTIINDYIAFTIEIGDDNNAKYMYVNYYFRYSSMPRDGKINNNDLVDFVSKVGYHFGIKNIIMYAEYNSCSFITNEIVTYGGNYCVDIYDYLSVGKIWYKNINEIKPRFIYSELDKLKTIDPIIILSKDDQDELYQIYDKSYKNNMRKEKHNLADFYVWLVDTYCIHVDKLVEKFKLIYKEYNPFINDYYVLNSLLYLHNRKMVSLSNLTNITDIDTDETTGIDYPKNEYRNEPKNVRLTRN